MAQSMVTRPGGVLARRPLHFLWLADCSGSMSQAGKIEALNVAVRETLPAMLEVAEQNPAADVQVRAIKFSHGASWHVAGATPLEKFKWTDLEADALQGGSVNADVVFMMDTSGSMAGEIEGVKRSCQEFADHIQRQGARVRLGLVGFDIGGHKGSAREANYVVRNLSRYTIGVWPLAEPADFKRNIQSLSLRLFGGSGCYLANSDTVDIFPHVARAFSGPAENQRILVIISDEMGDSSGTATIVRELKEASITAHVLGVAEKGGAHEEIASRTGGQFWDIGGFTGSHDFSSLLGTVAQQIAKEITRSLSDGRVSQGTDLGAALELAAGELKTGVMPERGLPPVLVLVTDGQPTDDYAAGLAKLMAEPWGKRAVRIGIGIGGDADLGVLEKFIGNNEIPPLRATNSQTLARYIKWASTAVLKVASSPAAGVAGTTAGAVAAVPIPTSTDGGQEVW